NLRARKRSVRVVEAGAEVASRDRDGQRAMEIDPTVNRPMKTAKLLAILGILLLVLAGCNRQHVASKSGLRMDAMDLQLTQITLNGDHAEALAEFRPKQGPTSMVLQVKYQLEKRDGSWVVLNGQPVGGQMSHPTGSTVPPGQPNPPGSLPPGHPPLTPPKQSPTTNPHP